MELFSLMGCWGGASFLQTNTCLRLLLGSQGWVDFYWALSPQGQACGPQLCYLYPPGWWETRGGPGGVCELLGERSELGLTAPQASWALPTAQVLGM